MPASLKSRIPAIAVELKGRMAAVVSELAEEIAEDARRRVPRDTGALADAIHVKKRSPIRQEVVAGDDEAFYGHMVEFGTTRTPPRPFLLPAFNEAAERAPEKAARALQGL